MAKKGQTKASASKRSKQQRAYNSSPAQKKRRAQRNAARRQAEKDGKVKKGDGKDIDHKNKGTAKGKLDNSKKNLRVRSKKANRADNRGTGGRKKSTKKKGK
jgi:hypothetical protein